MVAVTTFYIDDSGTRHPDHKPNIPKHNHDWFALGGVLIDDEEILPTNALIDAFRSRWPQMAETPLHSHEIRGKSQGFTWLGSSPGINERFLADLESLLMALPVTGLACVIDRPGYNKRYTAIYGNDRWSLCKSAFAISVERATKHAIGQGRKLRVYVERSSKKDDRLLAEYYKDLKAGGHWFDQANSEKYRPASPVDYQNTLYEFKTKEKTSRLMQIADLYLWPICMGGYDLKNYPYTRLLAAGKLIECRLPEDQIRILGSKYYCFGAP